MFQNIGNMVKTFIPSAVKFGVGTMIGGPAYGTIAATDQFVNDYNTQMAYDRQKEFYKHGVEWRAQSARRAGLSPLTGVGSQSAAPYTDVKASREMSELGLSQMRSDLYGDALRHENMKLQNKVIELDLKKQNRVSGFGIDTLEPSALHMWKENSKIGYYGGYSLLLGQDSSEAFESDTVARKEYEFISGIDKLRGVFHLDPRMVAKLKLIRPKSRFKDLVPLWSRKYGIFMNYPKKLVKKGQFFYPGEYKRNKKIGEPIDMPGAP